MDAELLMTAFLGYAKRVACSMSRDPEMESLAGLAALHAARTYDGKIRAQRWIARVTRQHVWNYWRRKRARPETLVDSAWLEMRVEAPWEEGSPPLPDLAPTDWQLLNEYYLQQCPLLVLARKYGPTSKDAIKARITALVSKLKGALDRELE